MPFWYHKMGSKDDADSDMYSYVSGGVDLEEENRILRETVSQLKGEVDRFRTPALMLAEVHDFHEGKVIIKVPNGNRFLVEVLSSAGDVLPGDHVLVEQKNLTIVDRVNASRKFHVERYVIVDKPTVSWDDIGGLEEQKREIREVVELPLLRPQIFRDVGITPPKGVLLHGPPGTGKTLLAKAVAAATNACFIEVVGSELVQKFIGEGAKLVKDIFELAKQRAPSIIFIDELDALAARRLEMGTSGEREVQRTFMQLLAEIDGFKSLGDIKIVGCTNRLDILDPAILRPGRLDRLIDVSPPDRKGLRAIFAIHARAMSFSPDFHVDQCLDLMDGFSGAEVRAVCTEAGYFAIREERTRITADDVFGAIRKVRNALGESNVDVLAVYG
ncbi:MAG: AAA family ATPase [Nanoarchaeota archaeon]